MAIAPFFLTHRKQATSPMLSNHVIRVDENKLKSNPEKTEVMLIKKIWSDLTFAFCKEKAGLLGVGWSYFGKGYNIQGIFLQFESAPCSPSFIGFCNQ